MTYKADPRYFILGTIPSDDDKKITGCRLPSARQVILCFMAHNDDPECPSVREAANRTVKTVLPFYEKARIPTLFPVKMSEEIIKLYNSLKSLWLTPHKRRDGETFKNQVQNFKDSLTKTMKFWPRDAMKRITNESDRKWLQQMIDNRDGGSMDGADNALSKKEKKIQQRKLAENERKKKEEERLNEQPSCSTAMDDPDGTNESEDQVQESDPTFIQVTPSRSHKRTVKTGTSAFIRHDFYLTEELVVLSLFNHGVPTDTKERIVNKLLQLRPSKRCVNRVGTGYGKPKLPPVPKTADTDLSQFVGEDSVMFFNMLKIDSSFLHVPIKDWDSNPAYQHGKELVANLQCVNDAAERGVKLCSDFLPRAKKEGNLQNILQTVENSRNKIPNQRKRKKESQNWYLVHE